MARGSTVYRAFLELAHVDRAQYARLDLTVARHPSETAERMLVRILAYAIRYEEGLCFGRGLSTPNEADLWSRDAEGRLRQWVEVGQPQRGRLLKAARRAEGVSVFAFGRGVEAWREAQLAGFDAPDNLAVCRIRDEFVEELSAGLLRKIEWSVTINEGVLYLDDGTRTLETSPQPWLGDPLC